jgi:hypothetical protein
MTGIMVPAAVRVAVAAAMIIAAEVARVMFAAVVPPVVVMSPVFVSLSGAMAAGMRPGVMRAAAVVVALARVAMADSVIGVRPAGFFARRGCLVEAQAAGGQGTGGQ